MKVLEPITMERIRRFTVLVFLAVFAWMFFYSPSDIYEIKVKDYVKNYLDKVKEGDIDASATSLDKYINFEMKRPYTWSSREQKIIEVEGESSKFLNHISSVNRGDSLDDLIIEHRSPDTFWFGNSYFFRESELPKSFLSQTLLKHPDYLTSKGRDGQKIYFELYKADRAFKLDKAPVSMAHPLRIYAYLLLILTILVYLMLPKPKVPNGAAYYTRFNAVYLADTVGFFFWTAAWMFFFLPDDSSMPFGQYILLLFFVPLAIAFILPTIKYASNWYFFTEDSFEWSDMDGIGKVPLKNVVSVKPYKRQLPKWVGPLMILFGRGNAVATGAGMISMSTSPEIGMEIMLKSGKKVKVMANYLEADDVFSQRFQALEKKLEGK